MKHTVLTVLIVFLFSVLTFAQKEFKDQLIKRDGKTILCHIVEIGDDEIKYNEAGIREDVLIGIDKSRVAMIVFADGKEYKIDNSMGVYEDLSTQNKNALKFNLFSPIMGGYAITYERSLKPARSFETELGLIAKSENNNMGMPEAHGLFIKAGYKMMRSPDFYMRGMKYAHILKGSYVKPEIALTTFSYDKNYNYYGYSSGAESGTETKLALIVNVGKQIVYTNAFAIDFYIGAGYAFGQLDSDLYYYSFNGFSSDVSFIMTGGVRVGFLFGEKKQ